MTVQNITKNNKGFTLIELLVVIGILAILLAITLIAINPARQFGLANDTKRKSDVTQILNAVGQYVASNGGSIPTQITTTALPLVSTNTDATALCVLLVPNYLPAFPTDPSENNQAGVSNCTAGAWNTHYTIVQDATHRITVSSDTPSGYSTGAITVTR
jgi:type IV pilus assembly protein PilA